MDAAEEDVKVLIIDDESDIRRIAQLSLSRVGGMDVVAAASGAEGIRMAESESPDAILLDVMMPGMDGPTTLANLVEKGLAPRIPVVFLTAKAMASEIERLKSLGARGVLTKPFDPMTLAGQLREVLAAARDERAPRPPGGSGGGAPPLDGAARDERAPRPPGGSGGGSPPLDGAAKG